MRSNEVFGTIEGVYSRKWYMEKRRELIENKESNSRIWGEI